MRAATVQSRVVADLARQRQSLSQSSVMIGPLELGQSSRTCTPDSDITKPNADDQVCPHCTVLVYIANGLA